MVRHAMKANAEAVDLARRVTRDRIGPRAAQYDRDTLSPVESWHDLWQEGLLAMTAPAKYGGMGIDALTYVMVLEEIAKGCTNTSMTLHMHSTVLRMIDALGTPFQKARLYKEVVDRGQLFGSWAAERNTSFTRAPFVSTSIRRAESGYVINGLKTFCTMAGAASYYGIWCSLNGLEDMANSMIFALVPSDTAGMEVTGEWDTLGMRGTVSPAVQLRDCFISDDMLLGPPGGALTAGVVEAFPLGYAAIYLGAATSSLEHATEYCKSAIYRPNTLPITHDPAIQRDVAGIVVELEAARLMLYDCASQWDQADILTRGVLSSKAKYLCTKAATTATQEALHLVGGRSASKSFPLERVFRDVHTCVLMPPSVNAMLASIGKAHFGLAEPMYQASD